MGSFRRILGAIVAASALSLPVALTAQSPSTATVRGTVTDEAGQPAEGVTVRLRFEPTGSERAALTDARGHFLLLLLQPGGPYTLTAERLGAAPIRREGIQLQVGETRTLELMLRVQAVPVEGVEVRAERTRIFSPTRVGQSTLVDREALGTLPIPSREVLELSALSPLVRTTQGRGFSVAGQNDRYNAILVDGISGRDAFGLTPSGIPGGQAGAKLLPLDAVAQYEIQVAPFDARLTGFAGGVMNAVTRTGTNDLVFDAFAIGQTGSLMGDLTLPSGAVPAGNNRRSLVGVSAGGPIVRDKLHYFVAGEYEHRVRLPTGYNSGRDEPALVGISPTTLSLVDRVLREGYGIDPGTSEAYDLGQDLSNVFGRLDWTLGGGHRLTVRDVFAYARNDEPPNRAPFEPYELSSNAVFRHSTANTLSAQLFSEVGKDGGNELSLTLQHATDETAAAAEYPQLEIVLHSPYESFTATRPVRVGAQFYAQDNHLSQTSLRLADALTLVRGKHTLSMGVSGAWYGIRHRYLPGSMGSYLFADADDFLIDAPNLFQRTMMLGGRDPEVRFGVLETGAFVQDRLELGALTLHLGARVDAPFVLDQPEDNPEIVDAFGYRTTQVPTGHPIVSPRLGVNWIREGAKRTQIRAGAGIFTGQLPYAWLANAFHNTGTRSATLVCRGRWYIDPPLTNTAPPFDPLNPNATCLNGSPTPVKNVAVFDNDFRYPEYGQISFSVDQELGAGLTATVGYLYSGAVHQVSLRELNLNPQDELPDPDEVRGYGGASRPHFGLPSNTGFAPVRGNRDYASVLVIGNRYGDRSWALSGELRGQLADQLSFQAGYAYVRSYDRMSLNSIDLFGALGSTPTYGDLNAPPITTSNFDRPHKVVLALWGTPIPGLPDTELSLLYTGESGVPFSYVYRGDLNGDGFPGPGAASDYNNDLIYVPENAQEVPSGIGTTVRLASALATDPCLRDHKGMVLPRNACRTPWQNRLDLRLAQRVDLAGASVRLEANVVNLLNLLDGNWGVVKTMPVTASLLEPFDRSVANGELFSEWAGGVLPFKNDAGELQTPEPWSVVSPDSQWQLQFGVRVSFGGAR